MKNEIWKEIEGYNGDYLISNLGNVCSNKFNKRILLKQFKNSRGYYVVGLYKNTKKYTVRVHRLVSKAFIPNPENKPEINHLNGLKTDNKVTNLEWATPKENTKHAYKNGLAKTTIKEAHEANKVPIYSKKLDIKFNSIVEAANYIQSNYFENTTLICLQTSISLLLNNKITKSKYDYGWQYGFK